MGSTTIDKEPCTSALPSGGAYILKEPDDKGSFTVGTYRWLPSEITVVEGGAATSAADRARPRLMPGRGSCPARTG